MIFHQDRIQKQKTEKLVEYSEGIVDRMKLLILLVLDNNFGQIIVYREQP